MLTRHGVLHDFPPQYGVAMCALLVGQVSVAGVLIKHPSAVHIIARSDALVAGVAGTCSVAQVAAIVLAFLGQRIAQSFADNAQFRFHRALWPDSLKRGRGGQRTVDVLQTPPRRSPNSLPSSGGSGFGHVSGLGMRGQPGSRQLSAGSLGRPAPHRFGVSGTPGSEDYYFST